MRKTHNSQPTLPQVLGVGRTGTAIWRPNGRTLERRFLERPTGVHAGRWSNGSIELRALATPVNES